jgi:putative serine protease PepD
MRTFVSFFSGAAAVGLVVGLLALGGVIDNDTTTSSSSPPSPPVSTPSGQGNVSTKPGTVADIYKRVSPGVVFVSSSGGTSGGGGGGLFGGGGGQQETAATGSGFVYDDQGHIVTNDHVVDGFHTFSVRIGSEPRQIPAQVVGTDPSSDLAVLKIDPSAVKGGLHPLTLGDDSTLSPGDQAIAIGSPFGLQGTVTEGIVSSLGRTIQAPNNFSIDNAIQTDAAINPGNSGGPLLDGNGRVIGINSQIESSSQQNSGVGFAIPVSTVKSVVPQIQNGGKVLRAYLGVTNNDSADNTGAVVAQTVPGGPAEKAGLQPGDKITAIDGRPVYSSGDVSAAVDSRKPGQKAKVTVERNGAQRTLIVDLGTRPQKVGP